MKAIAFPLCVALCFAGNPQAIEALSVQARAELAQRNYPKALADAETVYRQAVAELKWRPLDKEPSLPLALGAAIEVEAQVMNAEGRRAEAVAYLQEQLRKWYGTSIRARIQKNIHLLSLEGKPALPLDMAHVLGPKPPATKGRTTLLFFWAHWCSDCKAEIPVLARLQSQGLAIIAPTQHYGYIGSGEDAPPDTETKYIEAVRQHFYSPLSAPLSEENFRKYGVSTTPTLVVLDGKGIVRLYHPGAMTYEQIAAALPH